VKNIKLFELLILNCKDSINNYLMEKGKSPKIISPIQIKKKEKEENE
jgi:hypothetical protein